MLGRGTRENTTLTGVLGLPSEMTEREAGLASVGQLGRFGKSLQAHTVTGGDFPV